MMENKFYSLDPVCVGLDLHPYEARKSGVIQCDWHDVKKMADESAENNSHKNDQERQGKPSDKEEIIIQNEIQREHRIAATRLFQVNKNNKNENEKQNDENKEQQTSSSSVSDVVEKNHQFIESVDTFRQNSAHVVTFCLMLSYLPAAMMRLRCCFNALQFLKPHGLFIILSTRTQCNRKSKWEDQWIATLEKIGFERFRKDIRTKMVGMCFRKKKDNAFCYEKFEDIPEEIRKEGLPIRADFI